MSLRRQAAQGVFWSVIQRWGRDGIGFIVLVILARLLAPEAFGLVALAVVFIDFVMVFADQGLSAAIVQRKALEEAHLDTAFWISVGVGILFMLGGVAGSELLATLFDEPRLAPIIRWLSIVFLVQSLSATQTAILQRDLAFKSLAVRNVVARIVGGAVGVTMAFQGFGVWSLVAQRLSAGITGVVVLWTASSWRPGLKVSTKHYKDLFSFGVAVVGNNLLKALTRRADHLVIGYALGPTLLGFYTVGYRLLRVLLRVLTGIINAVAFPTFARLQSNPERMRGAFYKVTQYTSLVAFPVFIALTVLAPEVVTVVFGEGWGPSVPVLQVLALAGVLESLSVFNGSVMRASGKPSWQFGITLLTAVFSLIGYLVAVRWGMVAVAASYVIVGYSFAPLSFIAVRKLIGIEARTYARQLVIPVAASLLMASGVVALKGVVGHRGMNVYVELAAYSALGGMIYVLVISLAARSLLLQVMEMARLALPKWMLKRT